MLILGRALTKGLPDLAAMLNGDIFEIKAGQDEEGEISFDVGTWAENMDGTLSRIPEHLVPYLEVPVLSGDVLMKKLSQMLSGECGLKEDSDHIEQAEKAKWNAERDKAVEKTFDLIVRYPDEAWTHITPDMLPYIRDYVSEEFDLEADSGSIDIDERLE
ncbi:hypothetical protein BJX66DRAFT_335613 [Aspergillus keveii]|uniref:Uncharacterized protein n=1 Tax=Aspergillus keveii TaxID=714993 RepID=A0ABR4GCZ0_9EURO